MKIKLIIGFLFFTIFSLSCSNLNGPKSQEKIHFTLFTGERDSLSRYSVTIFTIDTINKRPIVTLQGTPPDTIVEYVGYFTATFKNVLSDSALPFKIVLYDDTLKGKITLPRKIDSLFCNGNFIENNYNENNYSDSMIVIDTSSSYLLRWTTKHKGDCFYVEYFGAITKGENKDAIVTDNSIMIIPDSLGLLSADLHVKIENWGENISGTIPAANSDKMTIYYTFSKPRYTCHFYAQSQ